jgi:hypothetical protein
MILQACSKLLDHFSSLQNGAFEPLELIYLIRFKLLSDGVSQFAGGQMNDRQPV